MRVPGGWLRMGGGAGARGADAPSVGYRGVCSKTCEKCGFLGFRVLGFRVLMESFRFGDFWVVGCMLRWVVGGCSSFRRQGPFWSRRHTSRLTNETFTC